MKFSRKSILLLTFVIGIAYVGYIVFFSPTSRAGRRNARNVKQVMIGMTKKDVIRLMGVPDSKELSHRNSIDTVYDYTPPFGASDGIFIHFNNSDTVNLIIDD